LSDNNNDNDNDETTKIFSELSLIAADPATVGIRRTGDCFFRQLANVNSKHDGYCA